MLGQPRIEQACIRFAGFLQCAECERLAAQFPQDAQRSPPPSRSSTTMMGRPVFDPRTRCPILVWSCCTFKAIARQSQSLESRLGCAFTFKARHLRFHACIVSGTGLMTQRIASASPPFEPDIAASIDRIMQAVHRCDSSPRSRAIRACSRNSLPPACWTRAISTSGNARSSSTALPRFAECEYEWGVHVAVFARTAKLSSEQIRSLACGSADDTCWNDDDRVLIGCAMRCIGTAISTMTWHTLCRHFSDEARLELLMLAGFYRTVSYLANALRLPLEAHATRFPSRTSACEVHSLICRRRIDRDFWHGDEYKAMVERVYGHPPVIRVLDSVAHVDATQDGTRSSDCPTEGRIAPLRNDPPCTLEGHHDPSRYRISLSTPLPAMLSNISSSSDIRFAHRRYLFA